jgi:hypothetical protein
VVTVAMAFSQQTQTITGGVHTITLNLGPGAPATVNVSSDTTSVATVPASVAVSGGVAQVPVTGVAFGTATIHASGGASFPDTTTSVTVGGMAFATPTFTITHGTTGNNINLILQTPAPAAFTMTVTSDNNGVASVPTGSISVPKNATTVPVAVTAGTAGSTTIHASGGGLADTTLAVTVN